MIYVKKKRDGLLLEHEIWSFRDKGKFSLTSLIVNFPLLETILFLIVFLLLYWFWLLCCASNSQKNQILIILDVKPVKV